ncbi:MAG: response regulator [Hyphomicrobium sp.]
MRILLIEDELGLGDAIRTHLTRAGHAVDWMQCLDTAGAAVRSTDYGLVLLDLRLPDGRGIDFLASLRKNGDRRPVMIITAQDQISDRVAGLNAGADDYIVKPFDLGELAARIEAVQRRYIGNPVPTIAIGDIVIDKVSHQLWVQGSEVPLTGREWALLIRLADRPGAIVSKTQLEVALYDFGTEVESNTVEVYVSRLRRKLGRDLIITMRGLGYRLQEQR